MAGGLFSRVKTWASLEVLTNEDLNAEFDNIIANFLPAKVDDYSVTVVQMQIQTSPGGVGTESQATSLAGEIERLRYVINRMIGGTYWYEAPDNNLNGLNTLFTSFTGLPDNRIESGEIRSVASGQPSFLVADGVARTVTLKGGTTPFIFRVAGSQYTISSNVTKTSLTAAPSTNNTALINNVLAADQFDTLLWGEEPHSKTLTIDNVGSEISNLVGKWAAFKLDNGSAQEYFIAYVNSATELTKAFRGYFFNSSGAPIKRIVFSDNDTITLMKLTFIYARTDGTLEAGYTNPTYSADEPTSPAVGDYWFDMVNNVWKTYNGGSFVASTSTLAGICIQDTSATVAARSGDFYAVFKPDNTLLTERVSNTIVQGLRPNSTVSVYGQIINFGTTLPMWTMPTDLAGSSDMMDSTEQASRTYYLYVTKGGDRVISDVFPYYRAELFGWYHPWNTWRCVTLARNNASSNIESIAQADDPYLERVQYEAGNGHGSTSDKIRRYSSVVSRTAAVVDVDSSTAGTSFTVAWPGQFSVGIADRAAGSYQTGISLNSTTLTTAIGSLTTAEIVAIILDPDGELRPVSKQVTAKVGDTYRPHDDGTPNDASAINSRFYAIRVARY